MNSSETIDMSAGARIVWIICFFALALWLAAMISAGIAAAFTFGTLPGLEVSLGEFSQFRPGDHGAHGRIAAGMVLERIFTAVDFIQFFCCFVLIVVLIIQFLVWKLPIGRLSNLIRASCIAAGVMLLSYHIFLLAPTMNQQLRRYWAAAKAGEEDVALAHRAHFDALHPRAEMILRANFILVAIAFGASVVAVLPESKSGAKGAPDRGRHISSQLETPRLAQRP